MRIRLYFILTVLALAASYFVNNLYTQTLFNGSTNEIYISDEIYSQTYMSDDFSEILNAKGDFLYCPYSANDELSYWKNRCNELSSWPSARKYRVVKDDVAQPSGDMCKSGTANCISKFLRDNCKDNHRLCIVTPSKKRLLRLDLYENDFIKKVLYDYERQYSKNK